jgi:hypothetical protein
MKSWIHISDANEQSSLLSRSQLSKIKYDNSENKSLKYRPKISSGHQLDSQTQNFMESHFGHDFSQVRIHDDLNDEKYARLMRARAFAFNNHIVFGKGEYAPHSTSGRRLLAHELAHIVQERTGRFASQNVLHFWGPEIHQKLTRDGVHEIMSGFKDLEIDPKALDLLAKYSTEMDIKWPELWFNIGGAILHDNISNYYRKHQKRALNHGEGGLYEEHLSKKEAERLNLNHQYIYEFQANKIYKEIPNQFGSTRKSELIKAQGRNAVFSKLGDALHVAQDRGAHGEGAFGFGHSRQGFNPDSQTKNDTGFEEARKNTESVLRNFDGILYLMLHSNWMRHHTITRSTEVEIKPQLKELSNYHYQDEYEREADIIAEQVTSQPKLVSQSPQAQTKRILTCDTCPLSIQSRIGINRSDVRYDQKADYFAHKSNGLHESPVSSPIMTRDIFSRPVEESNSPLKQAETNEVDSIRNRALPTEGVSILKALPSGECGTIKSSNPIRILPTLGPDQKLPLSFQHEMASLFMIDLGNVHIHTGPTAGKISETLGTRAFSIRDHIGFNYGEYQPYSSVGKALLIHELNHVINASRENDRFYGWFSRRLNPGIKLYLLGDKFRDFSIGSDKNGNTHEEITEQAIAEINKDYTKYNNKAINILLYWVAELDRWKTNPKGQTLDDLAKRFPELINVKSKAEGIPQAVGLLHAYKGANPEEIGFRGLTLTGEGVAGTLLNEAVYNYKKGHRSHGLRLLGISLHTIQDFFAHNYPLIEQGRDLRQLGAWQGGDENKDVLEDDPNIPSDRSRWDAARTATCGFLEKFYNHFMQRIEIK